MSFNKGLFLTTLAFGGTLLSGCATVQDYQLTKSPPFYSKIVVEPEVQVLAHGQVYDILEAVQVVFTSRQALYDWARSRGNMGTRVMSASGGVDFSQQNVVVVSPGVQPHAGYSLSLASEALEYSHSHGSLHLRINQPPAGQLYAQAVTAPYLVIKVPAHPYKQIGIDYDACPLQQVAYPG